MISNLKFLELQVRVVIRYSYISIVIVFWNLRCGHRGIGLRSSFHYVYVVYVTHRRRYDWLSRAGTEHALLKNYLLTYLQLKKKNPLC